MTAEYSDQGIILVTGGTGQIGHELLARTWPRNLMVDAPSRWDLDLTDSKAIEQRLNHRAYAAVINCAAYTAVDRAESERELAFEVNAVAPARLAEVTSRHDIPLIHLSTDYVFDGKKVEPYFETDPVTPLNVYGASKEAGERAVAVGNPNSIILRTAWVVSAHRTNFLLTMLRLAKEGSEIRVVDDQYGSPTAAGDIAKCLVLLTARLLTDRDSPRGIYHFVNAGEVTWFGFAREIFAIAAGFGIPMPKIEAISTADYPTPARRPRNSRLATHKIERDFGIIPQPHMAAVKDIIATLSQQTKRQRTANEKAS